MVVERRCKLFALFRTDEIQPVATKRTSEGRAIRRKGSFANWGPWPALLPELNCDSAMHSFVGRLASECASTAESIAPRLASVAAGHRSGEMTAWENSTRHPRIEVIASSKSPKMIVLSFNLSSDERLP